MNVLSLDAPLLALIWQAALAHCYHVRLMPGCYTALGLSVWFVYIADRTLDGFCKLETKMLSARHSFYRRNRFFFAFVILPLLLALLVWIVLAEIPQGILYRGLVLGGFVGLYLLLYAVRWNKSFLLIGNVITFVVVGLALSIFPMSFSYRVLAGCALGAFFLLSPGRRFQAGFNLLPKEILCGYLFAVGCSLSVCFFTRDASATPFSIETLLLALLCSLNCIAIACYEREMDSANDPDAITQTWPQVIRVYPVLLLTLAAISGVTLNQQLPREVFWFVMSILISTGLLGALHIFSKRLNPELSHVLADAALVTPLFLFAIH